MKKLLPEICDIQYGYAFDSAKFSDKDGIPLVRIRDVVRGYSETKTTEDFPDEYIVNDGDILIGMDGEFNIAKWRGGKAALNQRVCKLIPKTVEKDYIFHYMPLALKKIEDKTPFVTVKHLSAKELNKISVPYPDVKQQKRIAEALNNASKLISLRKKQLQKLDDLIKARFVEMFGSIIENRFPKCKLRDVAHIKHGFAFSGEFFSDTDNGVVLVTPGNFAIGGGFQENKNRYFTSDYPEEYILHAGDLIVTMTDLSKKADTLGYGAIVPSSEKVYLHNQRIGLFDKLDKMLNPIFVRWYMQTDEYRKEIVRTSTGSTVHHTSPDRILDTTIFVPPIALQNSFVGFAKQVDQSKLSIHQSLEKLETLKQSLMQQYFG